MPAIHLIHLIISFLFFHRPAPSPRLSLACLLNLIPRPRAWEAPTNRRSAIAGGVSICLLSIMPCRSLAAARSLLPTRHRSPRHRLPDAIASVPSVPSAASSSPRHHHLVITPAGHILPASRPAYLVEERGGDTGRLRLRDVRMSSPCCLLTPCRFHASDDLALTHLIPVAS